MKKRITYILLTAIISWSMSSCSLTEEDLFSESAAIRLNNSIANADTILVSAKNGWEMLYFPTKSSAGYNMLVKFDADFNVTVAAQNTLTTNGQYKTSKSLWDVIQGSGPILTFNTYNDVLHAFSDPQDDGVGYEGDYEFIVLSADSNTLKLKGVKRGTIIYMKRLAKNQSWTGYFEKLDSVNQTIFGRFSTTLKLQINGAEAFSLTNGNTHIFTFTPEGESILDSGYEVPFIITNYGLQLLTPINQESSSAQEFVLSDDKNELVSEDGNTKIISQPASDVLIEIISAKKYMNFNYSDEHMSSIIKNAYYTIDSTVSAKTRKLEYIGFTNNKGWGTSLAIYTTKTSNKIEGFLSFTISETSANELTLKFNNFGDSYDKNGKTYYDSYNLSDFVSLIEGEYIPTIIGHKLSSTTIRLTDKNNPNKWFDLDLK
ncbi:MAG: DUF4302 domain-containing protein [Paludibacter sp.]|nr:DUF4302 domain-containing protein [Paludibacter sp.]